MKKKKIKKIIDQSLINHHKNTSEKSMILSKGYEKMGCSYDESVSCRLKKLIQDIIKYRENINISYDDSHINIRIDDIKSLKKTNINSPYPSKTEDNMLSIDIERNIGFCMNIGYRKNTRYIDEKIYDEIIDVVKKRIREINAENFNDMWEIIVKDSGILRDNNLENLLD